MQAVMTLGERGDTLTLAMEYACLNGLQERAVPLAATTAIITLQVMQVEVQGLGKGTTLIIAAVSVLA